MVLGIDIGTSSIKLAVCEAERGPILALRTLKNDSNIDVDGASHRCQSPEEIMRQVESAVEDVTRRHRVLRIGIACQMHGILYVNSRGEAISPLYTWQDESGLLPMGMTTYLDALNEATGYQLVPGVAFGSVTNFHLAKTGRLPHGAARFCTIGDYLAMRLTGNRAPLTHISNAAGLGLFDLARRRFDHDAIERLGMDAALYPELARGYATAGLTRDGAAVSVAIGDNQASFLGAVDDWDREILLNLGTGGQMSYRAAEIVEQGGVETRPLVDDDYLHVFTSHCGGRAYAALEGFYREVVRMAGFSCDSLFDAMGHAMQRSPPTREKIEVRTAFCGTRAAPSRRGEIVNLTLDNFTPADLSRGFLKGMCMELYPFYEWARERRDFSAIACAGNAIRKNSELREAIAETFRLPLKLARDAEEAATGAALFAGRMAL